MQVWLLRRAAGAPPSIEMSNAVMKKYMEVGEEGKAVSMLRNLHLEALRPDSSTYLILLSTSKSRGNMEGIKFWIKCMEQEKNIIWTRPLYNGVLEALAQVDDREGVERWVQKMRREDPKSLSTYQFVKAITATEGNIERGTYWLGLMKRSGVKPTKFIYNLLLDHPVRKEMGEEIKYWLKKMEEENIESDFAKTLKT